MVHKLYLNKAVENHIYGLCSQGTDSPEWKTWTKTYELSSVTSSSLVKETSKTA